MRHRTFAVVALCLAACAPPGADAPLPGRPSSAEQDLVTRVHASEVGTCDAPGRPELAGQAHLRLVYVQWPSFREELCSDDLAAHLRAYGTAEVPVTVSFDPRGRGHALCAVGGVEANRLERGCSFIGVISGGALGYGMETRGDTALRDVDLPPWEARARGR
jgi:hypothetical protein